MNSILIKNANIIDTEANSIYQSDVFIKDGIINKVGENLSVEADQVIDATSLYLAPGFVDIHVHLRDPGFTHKEDIITGTKAAAKGGFTAVACMPNTKPLCDSKEVLEYILNKSKDGFAKVYPVACITKGMQGNELSDFETLKEYGAIAVSDDGRPVENARMMQQALEEGYKHLLPVISHCEDLDIIDGGIINKGRVSEKLGVKGMDRSSEDSITAREIALASATNTSIHIAHVSTKDSVCFIRDAKRRGIKVTSETAPHYFLLTDEMLLTKDADYRMNPPLREQSDVEEIIKGIKDNTIDVIVTDHAPHAEEEKSNFEKAPNGVVGLETSFAASYTGLVLKKHISLIKLVAMMSQRPREILNLKPCFIKEGNEADLVLFNTEKSFTVKKEDFVSKSKNSAFKNRTLQGVIEYTFLNGKITYSNN